MTTEKVANFQLLSTLVAKMQENSAVKIPVPQFTFQTQASNKEIKSHQFEKYISNTANEKRFLLPAVSHFMTHNYGVIDPFNTNNVQVLHDLARENGQKVSLDSE